MQQRQAIRAHGRIIGHHQPDKSIQLLDEACALAREVVKAVQAPAAKKKPRTKPAKARAKAAARRAPTKHAARQPAVRVQVMHQVAHIVLEQVGSGLCNAAVAGDVAAVKAAIDTGAAAAAACGEVVSAHVIARPDDAIDSVLPKDAAARAPRK